jgi:hypothetical protein
MNDLRTKVNVAGQSIELIAVEDDAPGEEVLEAALGELREVGLKVDEPPAEVVEKLQKADREKRGSIVFIRDKHTEVVLAVAPKRYFDLIAERLNFGTFSKGAAELPRPRFVDLVVSSACKAELEVAIASKRAHGLSFSWIFRDKAGEIQSVHVGRGWPTEEVQRACKEVDDSADFNLLFENVLRDASKMHKAHPEGFFSLRWRCEKCGEPVDSVELNEISFGGYTHEERADGSHCGAEHKSGRYGWSCMVPDIARELPAPPDNVIPIRSRQEGHA